MKRSQSLGKSLDDVKYEQYVNNLHDRLPQLTDPNDIDCQRWPWELLQNAKDTVVKRKNPEYSGFRLHRRHGYAQDK